MKKEKINLKLYGCWAVFEKRFSDKADYPVALFMNLHDAEIFIEKHQEKFKVTDKLYIEEVDNTLLLRLK